MGKEIERKFLVENEAWRELVDSSSRYEQAYLSTSPQATVRVRVSTNERGDSQAFLTVKGISTQSGLSRDEWEYAIPVEDARAMISHGCVIPGSLISKTRHKVGRWEIDEFHGNLQGLVLAEIELRSELEPIPRLPFRGTEVTGDPRYYNSSLALHGIPE